MLKMRLIWLAVTGLLLFSALAWAAPPQDCTVAYTFKNPDGQVFRVIKYYLSDSLKFRVDYLSKDGTVNAVNIYRKDKGLIWSLNPSTQEYKEKSMEPDEWDYQLMGIFVPEFQKAKKNGETKIFNYPCDIYEAERSGWTTISYIAQGMNIALKTELKEKEKLVQIMEATEFQLKKPAASLFEIPAGYQKQQN